MVLVRSYSFDSFRVIQGTGAPCAAEPSSVVREGKGYVHSHQNEPRGGKEMGEYYQEKEVLSEAFRPMFEWITKQVFSFMPMTFRCLCFPASDSVPKFLQDS